jgi:hypothetical protein
LHQVADDGWAVEQTDRMLDEMLMHRQLENETEVSVPWWYAPSDQAVPCSAGSAV